MYSIDYTKRFNKDLKRCMKRGLDLQMIHEAIALLRATGTLPMKYRTNFRATRTDSGNAIYSPTGS